MNRDFQAGVTCAQGTGTNRHRRAQVSSPTVIRFGPTDWRMWAYGREANFSSLYPNFSFGRSGYFVSSDGRGPGLGFCVGVRGLLFFVAVGMRHMPHPH